MFSLPKLIKLLKRKEDQKSISIGVQNCTKLTPLRSHALLVQELWQNNLFDTDIYIHYFQYLIFMYQ